MNKQMFVLALALGISGMVAAQNQAPQENRNRERQGTQVQNPETHGQEVSNVARTTESGPGKGEIVSQAAQSRREERKMIREQRRAEAQLIREQRRTEAQQIREQNQRMQDGSEVRQGRPDQTRPQGGQRPNRPNQGQGSGRPR